jgi:release factor glutamine methyltransferase
VVKTGSGRRVSDLLTQGRGGGGGVLPPLDVQVLLAAAIGESREFLYTHPERGLNGREHAVFEGFLARRRAGEPVAYITGKKEFYSLVFKVGRQVLIPRPETELLVDEVLARRPASLLDMGTGSGNIAVTVKHRLRSCFVLACDTSGEALDIAAENARELLGVNDIRFVRSRFFEGLGGLGVEFGNFEPRGFDIIVSNPPYLRRGEITALQREVREYEPLLALDGGEDGLDAYRSILGGAKDYLAPGGRIVLETDPEVLPGLLRLAGEAGYRLERAVKDLQGLDRMVVIA